VTSPKKTRWTSLRNGALNVFIYAIFFGPLIAIGLSIHACERYVDGYFMTKGYEDAR
jgi:hypothetical protein